MLKITVPTFTFLLFTAIFNPLRSQAELVERTFDWSSSGLENDFQNDEHKIIFTEFGGENTGNSDNSQLLQEIIDNAEEQTTIIFLEGEYLFRQGIVMKSHITLLGQSSKTTKLVFDIPETQHCIHLAGRKKDVVALLFGDHTSKNNFIDVDRDDKLEQGMMVYLEPNDEDLITSDWALGSTGHLSRIVDFSYGFMTLAEELRRDFPASQETKVVEIEPIENVMISNLEIERRDQTDLNKSNIYFNYANNCKVTCIQSYKTNFAHINISNSYHVEVSSSKFESAFDYGGGGKGYGIVLQYSSASNLLFNNIFRELRHAMLLQAGANGNVVAYNYSFDPYWEDTYFNSDAAGDLVLHGNYPYANLLEGNVVQNVVIDQSHGSNGPYNTLFRNRVENYGIICANFIHTDFLNIIANETVSSESGRGQLYLTGDNHMVVGNNIKGEIDQDEAELVTSSSLYLNENPFDDNLVSWPVISFPQEFNGSIQNASYRFENGFDLCTTEHISSNEEVIFERTLTVHPNPSFGTVNISFDDSIRKANMILVNQLGQEVLSQEVNNREELELSHLPKGIYFIHLHENDLTIGFQKIILN